MFTDADWAGDTKSMKSTSSVFTRIDGFIIGMNAQLQDTHAQRSGESEFHVLGEGCADGLHVKAIPDDLGMRAKINLRCDAKAARALAQRQGVVQAYTTRESEALVRARSRQSERNRSVESCDRNEPGRHWDETFAESQTGIPEEFDGKELRDTLQNKSTDQHG